MAEQLQIRVHGDPGLPVLVYLPGLHGDWTLVSSFRAAVAGRMRFVEFIYPRTLTWSLEDYAAQIQAALTEHGIHRGWVLGESFGSQVAWALCNLGAGNTQSIDNRFKAEGLILAGGFVRHPAIWGVRLMRALIASVARPFVRVLLRVYTGYAKFRHRHAPETLASIGEFVARRTDLDRQAAAHRLSLIISNDLRPIARQFSLPAYYLAGLIDPLVPWLFVRWWLRRNCPGYKGGKTFWAADHNVLGTAPQAAAEQIQTWITQ